MGDGGQPGCPPEVCLPAGDKVTSVASHISGVYQIVSVKKEDTDHNYVRFQLFALQSSSPGAILANISHAWLHLLVMHVARQIATLGQ